MKNFKIFSTLILVLGLFACEKEQVNNLDPEKFLQNDVADTVGAYGEYHPDYTSNNDFLNSKSSHEIPNFRVYNSQDELLNDCPNFTHLFSKVSFTPSYGYYGFNFTYVQFVFESQNFEETMLIEVRNSNGETTYLDEIIIKNTTYYGLSSDVPMNIIVARYKSPTTQSTFNITTRASISCDFVPAIIDTDGDGIPDDVDPEPNSNNETTIVIDGCDSGIDNFEFGDGFTLSDKIDELEAGDYKNHGEYVKTTAKYLTGLVKAMLITNEQKDTIMSCVGSSSI